jgi:hypothetical protein
MNRKFGLLVVIMGAIMMLQGCRLWEKIFPPKYGCPTNGKNIGAERVLSDPKAEKAAKKAKKFKT